ncbi:MAG: D-alanyl-D-alanine carboxypeptidase [Helicobacter sp.]|nr:D-alanyl-D-alanine carboxypeptidase [Helicobacter sp.]
MKILLLILLPCLLWADSLGKLESEISSLIVKDLQKQKILYSKASNQKMRPASLTKIMTAMLAIESGQMNKLVTIPKEATRAEPSKLGLKAGDKVYLRDLVKATLIGSANDAAVAIGIAIGGSTKKFVAMMNRKARMLGMHNTRFTNAAGLDIGAHYSSASDLMKLAEYAIGNATFNQIVKANAHSFRTANTKRSYIVRTTNRLLKERKYAVGVKTGYTSQAGPCLIARGKKDGKDVLLVMLNQKAKRWESAAAILDIALGEKKEAKNMKAKNVKATQASFEGRYVTPY